MLDSVLFVGLRGKIAYVCVVFARLTTIFIRVQRDLPAEDGRCEGQQCVNGGGYTHGCGWLEDERWRYSLTEIQWRKNVRGNEVGIVIVGTRAYEAFAAMVDRVARSRVAVSYTICSSLV